MEFRAVPNWVNQLPLQEKFSENNIALDPKKRMTGPCLGPVIRRLTLCSTPPRVALHLKGVIIRSPPLSWPRLFSWIWGECLAFLSSPAVRTPDATFAYGADSE